MTRAERISPGRPTRVRFTADEFMDLFEHEPFSEWVGKIELVRGEIVRISPAHIPHWSAQRGVFLQLLSVYADLGPEWLVGTEPTIRVGPRDVREPDVAVFRSPVTSGRIFEVADLILAVEVSDSTLRDDLGWKRRDYAAAGIPHYWVVNVNGHVVHVMTEPQGADYGSKRVVAFGEPIAVPGADATVTVE